MSNLGHPPSTPGYHLKGKVMPIHQSSNVRHLPVRAMTPREEARDRRHYKLTTVVSGTFKITEIDDHEYAHDLARRTSDLLIESGVQDWAVFVEDQHRIQYHHEYREGILYREPYCGVAE